LDYITSVFIADLTSLGRSFELFRSGTYALLQQVPFGALKVLMLQELDKKRITLGRKCVNNVTFF
jgi:hypothetical protein